MKNKKEFKTGMIYRSKTHPQFDLIIDYVSYNPSKLSDYGNIVCWCNINRKAFEDFVELKGKNMGNTFPYPYCGECSIKSMRQRIKKYNLEFVAVSDDEINFYEDSEFMYSSGFKNHKSHLSD